jgi:hypothetical protein
VLLLHRVLDLMETELMELDYGLANTNWVNNYVINLKLNFKEFPLSSGWKVFQVLFWEWNKKRKLSKMELIFTMKKDYNSWSSLNLGAVGKWAKIEIKLSSSFSENN